MNAAGHQRDAATIWATAPRTEAGWRTAVAEHARLPGAWRHDYVAVQRSSNAWLARGEISIFLKEMIFATETELATAERHAARRAERKALR